MHHNCKLKDSIHLTVNTCIASSLGTKECNQQIYQCDYSLCSAWRRYIAGCQHLRVTSSTLVCEVTCFWIYTKCHVLEQTRQPSYVLTSYLHHCWQALRLFKYQQPFHPLELHCSPAYDPISNMLANFGTLVLIKVHSYWKMCKSSPAKCVSSNGI